MPRTVAEECTTLLKAKLGLVIDQNMLCAFQTRLLRSLQQRSIVVCQRFTSKQKCKSLFTTSHRLSDNVNAASYPTRSVYSSVKRSQHEKYGYFHNVRLHIHRFSSSTIHHVDNDSCGKGSVGQIEAKMQIAYTCKVCSTRNHQTFSKQSYNEGVVIVKCKGCNNHHLISDNLGWFKDIGHRNIEEILAAKGEKISKITASDEGPIEIQSKGE